MRLFPKDRDLNAAPEEVELAVAASSLGQRAAEVHVRLDHYLMRVLTWRSRSSIQALIRDGYVSVAASAPDVPGGGQAFEVESRPGRRLLDKSRIRIRIPEPFRLQLARPATDDLVVLYEDNEVLAVDKPPFLAVHPSGRHMSGTLIQKVYALYPQIDDREARPRLCHRLDRETSGIVLVGKTAEAHADCRMQFERRRVEKEYLAIVTGRPSGEGGVIDLPIGPARASDIGLKMAARTDGTPARTDWNVLERYEDCTLVACRPLTGRQHQIRVHFAALGYPLVGDKLYGSDEALFQRALDGALTAEDRAELGLGRHALHNHRLVFRSPATGATVEVKSPLPGDLRGYLEARARA